MSGRHETTPARLGSYLFETPDYRGKMVCLRVFAKSEGVARYRFRRLMLERYGARARTDMIHTVSAQPPVQLEHKVPSPACQLERSSFLAGGQSAWRCGRCGMQARATDKPACPREMKRDAR